MKRQRNPRTKYIDFEIIAYKIIKKKQPDRNKIEILFALVYKTKNNNNNKNQM